MSETPLPPLPGGVLCDLCPFPATRRLKQKTPSAFQWITGVSLRTAYCCELHIFDALAYVRTGVQPPPPRRRRRGG